MNDTPRGNTAATMSPRCAVRTVPTGSFANSRRPAVRGTTFLAFATCLFVACARPNATPTAITQHASEVTNPPGHVTTLVVRLTALAASPTTAGLEMPTRWPSPTRTPITHRPSEPAAVVLSRDAAVAHVLALFLPEQAARVVSVTYLSNVDFWDVVDRLGGDDVLRDEPGTAIMTSSDRFENRGDFDNEILALVEVDARPARQLAPDLEYAPTWTTLPWASGTQERGRRRIGYLFNATTGASLGSPYLGNGHGFLPADDPGGTGRVVLRALQARSIQVVVATVSASPAASTPTATTRAFASVVPTSSAIPGLPAFMCLPPDSDPIRLPPDAVPAALAETIRWLPYVETARWTYEHTKDVDNVQWLRGRKEVKVEERWRLAKDAMLVRISEAMTTSEPGVADPRGVSYVHTEWQVLRPSGSYVVGSCGDGTSSASDFYQKKKSGGSWGWDVNLDPTAPPSDLDRATWQVDAIQTLPSSWQLPPGSLESCRSFMSVFPTPWEVRRYACPGVGWVAEQSAGYGGRNFEGDTDMLISYHIPRWRVIP